MSGTRRSIVAVALVMVMAGCGVPLSDEAQPIPGARVTPSSPTPMPSGGSSTVTGTMTVWYVDDARLVPRAVPSAGAPSADEALALLGVAPDPGTGLVTLIADPVGGPPLAALPSDRPTPSESGVSPGPSAREVVLSQTFGELTAEQQVLLIGQVVLTLTEIDPGPVSFVDEAGAPLSVPLPDGRLRDGPVTRGDYVALS